MCGDIVTCVPRVCDCLQSAAYLLDQHLQQPTCRGVRPAQRPWQCRPCGRRQALVLPVVRTGLGGGEINAVRRCVCCQPNTTCVCGHLGIVTCTAVLACLLPDQQGHRGLFAAGEVGLRAGHRQRCSAALAWTLSLTLLFAATGAWLPPPLCSLSLRVCNIPTPHASCSAAKSQPLCAAGMCV